MYAGTICWDTASFRKKCKSIHVNKLCEDQSCDITNCDLRHPKPCKFYSEYKRCKFGEWCSYKHVENSRNYSDSKYCEIVNKVNLLEKRMEEKDSIIEELLKKIDSFVLKSEIEQIQKIIDEKDILIRNLQEKIDALKDVIDSKYENEDDTDETEIHEITFCNPSVNINCEECDFIAKNERGLKIHRKSKHDNMQNPVTEIELNIYTLATEGLLNINRDAYQKELEMETDFVVKIVKMHMDVIKSKYLNYAPDYIGKFLPTQIILETKIPKKWKECTDFRNKIWDKINSRLTEGKMSEIDETKK